MPSTSCFEYLYRDDDNYKQFGSVALSGDISDADKAMIVSKLEMGEMFVAEQVGLPSLRNEAYGREGCYNTADNGWHWIIGIKRAESSQQPLMPARELVERFRAVRTWDLDLAEIRA